MTKSLVDEKVVVKESKISSNNTWIRTYSYVDNSIIDENVFIGFKCYTVIGKRTQIANSCTILGQKSNKIVISDDVWLGAGITIAPGVHIGEGAVIGAGTYVVNDVSLYSIIVGSPGKFLKTRKIVSNKKLSNSLFIQQIRNLFKRYPPKFKGGFANYTGLPIPNSLEVEKGTVISGRKSTAFPNGGFQFGKRITIKNNCILEGAGRLSIGETTTIDCNTIIITTSHDNKLLSLPQTNEKVVIDDKVRIEKNAIILPGVHLSKETYIPDESIVFKNSTVKKRGKQL
ncbi:DapH/DapD/GlmU-related protein [Pediococcus siamensis]|uniref:DapH/DapD/GlmU-related protein n=1 Tax=Pediococcus siamensis TaxID=381829 RepID=UPI00399F47DC